MWASAAAVSKGALASFAASSAARAFVTWSSVRANVFAKCSRCPSLGPSVAWSRALASFHSVHSASNLVDQRSPLLGAKRRVELVQFLVDRRVRVRSRRDVARHGGVDLRLVDGARGDAVGQDRIDRAVRLAEGFHLLVEMRPDLVERRALLGGRPERVDRHRDEPGEPGVVLAMLRLELHR